ncbi:MAG: protein-glutamine glutaminase family protein [Pseudobdellovibrionaceae bacterium]
MLKAISFKEQGVVFFRWILLSFLVSPMASAQLSAERDPKISGQVYFKAAKASLPKIISSQAPKMVLHSTLSLQEMGQKLTGVAAYSDSQKLQTVFEEIRDERFLSADPKPEFPRRLSWLYPADGCFARAEYMSRKLQEKGLPAPTKVFAFGSLRVATPNASLGSVSWWYHVVVGYNVEGQVKVFDPAIDPVAPMNLEAWLGRMSENLNSVKVSFCDSKSFDPTSPCQPSEAVDSDSLLTLQRYYLEMEWGNMVRLGKNPEKVLGDLPPWKLN